MPRGDQLTRQWRLLQRLGHSGGLTIVDAARELGCSVRTVWRDLKVLQDAGFPLFNDPRADGHRDVWQVESSFRQRLPLPLTLPEAVALLVSRQWLAAMGPSAFRPAIASVIDKLRALLGKGALDLIDRMADAVRVRVPGGKLLEPAAEHLGAIHAAIAERRSLQLRYYSMSRDAETERRVDPYHVTWFDGGPISSATAICAKPSGSSPSSASGRWGRSRTASRVPPTSTPTATCETPGGSSKATS